MRTVGRRVVDTNDDVTAAFAFVVFDLSASNLYPCRALASIPQPFRLTEIFIRSAR